LAQRRALSEVPARDVDEDLACGWSVAFPTRNHEASCAAAAKRWKEPEPLSQPREMAEPARARRCQHNRHRAGKQLNAPRIQSLPA